MHLDYDMPQPLTVEAFENHIYFYSVVDTDRCLALTKSLLETDRYLQTERLARKSEYMEPIWLHIQSFGGDPFAAFSVADQINTLTSPVYSIVEGCCASAATIISIACKKRYILPNAFMMIHQPSTFFAGTHEDLKDELCLLEMMSGGLQKWYIEHTKLTEEELNAKLKRNFWMDAKQSIEFGFCDAIYSNA